jgi:hypothetical protein
MPIAPKRAIGVFRFFTILLKKLLQSSRFFAVFRWNYQALYGIMRASFSPASSVCRRCTVMFLILTGVILNASFSISQRACRDRRSAGADRTGWADFVA